MSLKEFTKEIFQRYGFTDEDIKVYLGYLRVPRATLSEVYLTLAENEEEEMEYDQIAEITNKLTEKGFLKELPGVVTRYITLEPYFELFTNESEGFRNEIAVIKEKVFTDQSDRFEKLESIQNESIREVESAVDAQVKDFFEDSDNKNSTKKFRIETSKNRFTDTNKTLEKELHSLLEEDYTRFSSDVNKNDEAVANIWDANSSKFTGDNDTLNNELTEHTNNQVNSSKEQESKIHHIMDTLNSDLNSISEAFVSDNESGINTAKENVTKIVADLLKDFSDRVNKLEKELKQQLDEHVSRHENIASELKPKMEQILEKYLERMDKIVVDLKNLISKLLNTHITHVKTTTEKLESDLKERVEERHNILKSQATDFKNTTLTLIDNLLEHANRFTDFSEDMAKKGFFWMGKKAKYKARHETTIENILVYTEPMKDLFVNESDKYINDTEITKNDIKSEVASIMANEHESLSTETNKLDQEAQETLNAELELLASDMSSEIEDTLKGGVRDCGDTSLKLKDSLENSLVQHHKDYENAITRHKDESLRHYTDFDTDIKRKNENWVKDMGVKFDGSKRDITAEIETQVRDLNEHLEKTKSKNVDHSKTFNSDVTEVKSKQRTLYDELLNKVRTDFDSAKSNISGKIDAEINLWNKETTDIDTNLSEMLESHKTKYDENAKTLQNSLSTTIKDNIQNTKDAIADFTLNFMNAIDDANEFANTNESKLKDIFNASSSISEIFEISTWHTTGLSALIGAIKDAVYRTKSSIIIVMPIVVPEVLQIVSEFAFQRKAARFMLTSHWDLSAYGGIIEKMKQLGNIQFRQLSTPGEYYAVTRDAEEVILCPKIQDEKQMISIISNHSAYAKLYSSFIGPIFQANSRPIR